MHHTTRLFTSTVMTLLICGSVLAANYQVEMKNSDEDGLMVFEPGFLKVEPVDTLEFVSTDPSHNSI